MDLPLIGKYGVGKSAVNEPVAWSAVDFMPSHLRGNATSGMFTLNLRIGTYNTLSLQQTLQQDSLRQLFVRDGANIVGLQETRLDQEGIVSQGPFLCLHSRADKWVFRL